MQESLWFWRGDVPVGIDGEQTSDYTGKDRGLPDEEQILGQTSKKRLPGCKGRETQIPLPQTCHCQGLGCSSWVKHTWSFSSFRKLPRLMVFYFGFVSACAFSVSMPAACGLVFICCNPMVLGRWLLLFELVRCWLLGVLHRGQVCGWKILFGSTWEERRIIWYQFWKLRVYAKFTLDFQC